MGYNVYEETEYPNAEEQFTKAQIVFRINQIIKNTKLTQAEVAKITGLTQPQISNILRGIFRDISVERLLKMATALNYNVRIIIDTIPTENASIQVLDSEPTPKAA